MMLRTVLRIEGITFDDCSGSANAGKAAFAQVERNTSVAVFSTHLALAQCLLQRVAGLERFSRGEIWWSELAISQIPMRIRRMQLKPQMSLLSESMGFLAGYNVLQNLHFALRFQPSQPGTRNSEADIEMNIRAQTLLAQVGALELATHMPSQLNNSQRVRAGLAKALAQQPRLLLIDALPEAIAANQLSEWQNLILTITNLQDITSMFATTSSSLAQLAHQIIWLSDGE
jgi:putative ABC transport system ATP-binding protein